MPSRRAAVMLRGQPAGWPSRLALAAGVLAGLALPAAWPAAAQARPAAVEAVSARHVTSSPVTVTITSVSPSYARPGQKVSIRGTVSSRAAAPVSGVTVQLLSSAAMLTSRDELQEFAAGLLPGVAWPQPGAVARIRGVLRPGATARWRAVLPVNEVHMASFGVYPLAAQASGVSKAGTAPAVLDTSWTFLPFWPTGRHVTRPRPADIAWIWPLIDTPDQGPCPAQAVHGQAQGQLLNNHLAASLAPGGRLAGLLSAGSSRFGREAQLTWAIDPALLTSAQIMKHPYGVGANLSCQSARSHQASAAASSWLSRLQSAVSSQPAFVTPYADVDMTALTGENLATDLQRAFAEGRSAARGILHRSFAPTSGPTPAALIGAAAWPADGLVSYGALEDLAGQDGIRTVVLSSAAMPPAPPVSYTPGEVASTPNGEHGDMRVLLADSTLTQILSGVSAQSASPGSSFALRQRFLAETAMIAQQSPGRGAIVVAPPRRWSPPASVAGDLLRATVSAPWLSPVSAGRLAASKHPPDRVPRQAPNQVDSRRLRPSLLRAVRSAERGVQLVESLQVQPDQQLYQAVAGIQSSRWRGGPAAARPARAILRRVTSYVRQQQRGVSIVGGPTGRDTLGGQKGNIPVSIDNKLGYPVRVKVKLTIDQTAGGAGFTVLTNPATITQTAPNTFVTRTIPVVGVVTQRVQVKAAALGSTTISLQLLAPDGQPIGQRVTMKIQATHFGTFALIILAAALGVFMITSATRAVRRGRLPAGAPGADGPQDDLGDPDASDAPTVTRAGGPEQAEETDNVGHDRAGPDRPGTDHAATEDADDYARVPGRTDRG